jgi:S-phase kinase-associated protein 1
MSSPSLTLQSLEGDLLSISERGARRSKHLKEFLDDSQKRDRSQPIPVPVEKKSLVWIVDYLEYHSERSPSQIKKPVKGDISKSLSEWERGFLEKLDSKELIDCMIAANLIGCAELFDLTCGTIASMLHDKSPVEIREMFQIENDFTSEEEVKVIEENRWH